MKEQIVWGGGLTTDFGLVDRVNPGRLEVNKNQRTAVRVSYSPGIRGKIRMEVI